MSYGDGDLTPEHRKELYRHGLGRHQERFREWAILELMGHVRVAGFITEETIAGAGLLRIDIPSPNGKSVTQYFNPTSIYRLTPTDEDTARKVAAIGAPAPVNRWELPAPSVGRDPAADPYGDADEDDEPNPADPGF